MPCFVAGPELVQWEIARMPGRSFRLTLRHAHGLIVEYFTTLPQAMSRQQTLEALILEARGCAPSRVA
ncbi:MAG TPA: hypothetical protein VF713_11715 [Thermoanaerobaculia bacterium]